MEQDEIDYWAADMVGVGDDTSDHPDRLGQADAYLTARDLGTR
ncbi:MAG: hypothetical protein M0Z95_09205 [Actinomycetota bacterium]|jgi:hypothetical protein|nr:hypothetical protein [Actinomycetota bacterium]